MPWLPKLATCKSLFCANLVSSFADEILCSLGFTVFLAPAKHVFETKLSRHLMTRIQFTCSVLFR